MGNDRDLNPPPGENSSSVNPGNNGSAMTRAQSNLDILSQTAAVMVEEEGIVSAQASPPYPSARVTPAELPSSGSLRSNHDSFYVVESSSVGTTSSCRNSFLLLPDMSSRSGVTRPAVILEQKRGGFLPPPFESGSVLVGGCGPHAMEASSSYYSPGLFVSYSNTSSHPSVTLSSSEGYSVASRSSPPPVQVQQIPQSHHTTMATVSTGSDASTGGGSGATSGNVGTAGGDVTTVMNSFLSAASNSFSSTGGLSSSSVIGSVPTGANTVALPPPGAAQFSMQAFVPPLRPPVPPRTDGTTNIEFSDETVRENFLLRQQLAARDVTIANLQSQLDSLQREVRQLRRLPTGKISQIPLEDMLEIMREYGSEVSETSMPPRKSFVQHASVVRQFRRWNPNFHDWFEHVEGQWQPKLGKAGELKRREEARRTAGQQRKKQKIAPEEPVTKNVASDGAKHATEV